MIRGRFEIPVDSDTSFGSAVDSRLGYDRAGVTAVALVAPTILWCGLESGTIKVIDLDKKGPKIFAPEPQAEIQDDYPRSYRGSRTSCVAQVLSTIEAHSDCITKLLEVGSELWSCSRDGTIAVMTISPPGRVVVDPTTQAAVSQDGTKLEPVSLDEDPQMRYDRIGYLPNLAGHHGEITDMVLSTANELVYSCDAKGTVLGWNVARKVPVIQYSNDGQITSISTSENVLWLGLSAGVVRLDVSSTANVSVKVISIASNQVTDLGESTPDFLKMWKLQDNNTLKAIRFDPVHSIQELLAPGSRAGVGNGGESDNTDDDMVIVDPPPTNLEKKSGTNLLASDGCKSLVYVPNTGELWVAGFGFIQVWSTQKELKLRVAWNCGQRDFLKLAISKEENVICAAASDGFLHVFDLTTARPILRMRCHNDIMTSLSFFTDVEYGTRLACGSCGWDGSVVLCDKIKSVRKTGCSRFMTKEIAASAAYDHLKCDWLGYFREKSQSSFEDLRQIRFDESITETNSFVQHQLAWAKWSEIAEKKNLKLQIDELSCSLVNKGIPAHLRLKLWWEIIQLLTADNVKFLGENYYRKILDHKDGKTSAAIRQIDLDLNRTLPTNMLFRPGQQTVAALRRVLVAFSWFNPRIGYCQGLNRIAAFFLLVLEEEQAFWGLVGIAERHMGYEYYTDPLIVARADLSIFKDLIVLELPELNAKFDSLDFDVGAVSFQWFFTGFVTSLPAQFAMRIWDSFLLQGRDVFFKYALAVLKLHERELMEMTDQIEAFNLITKGLHVLENVDLLTDIALTNFSPEIGTHIKRLRNIYEPEARMLHAKALQEIAAAAAQDS